MGSIIRLIICALWIYVLVVEGSPAETGSQSSDFSKIVSAPEFVDKSLLIKEVHQHNSSVFISAPRLFGKSTNMDMVKRFFEIVVNRHGQTMVNVKKDENGKLVERSEENLTENFKLFKRHNVILYEEDKEFFYKHFGQYPVIYVDFKTVIGSTVGEVLETLKTAVRDAFTPHAYLLNCRRLWKPNGGVFDKTKFDKFVDAESHKELTERELKNGLTFLSEVLRTYFSRRVLVLIDDLDAPILKILFDPGSETKGILKLINGFISESLDSAENRFMIQATTELPKVFLSRFTNITHCPFLNGSFSKFYGFSEHEVETLIKSNTKEIENWYGGYTIYHTRYKIYNPWSVVNYFKERLLKHYWTDAVGIDKLDDIFQVQYVQLLMTDLLNSRVVCFDLRKSVRIKHLLRLQNFINNPHSFGDFQEKEAWFFLQFLYHLGYLNIIHLRHYEDALSLEIPNLEIGRYLTSKFYTLAYYKKIMNFNSLQVNLYNSALNSLSTNNTLTFANLKLSLTYIFSKDFPKDNFDVHRILYTLAKNSTHFRLVYGELFGKLKADLAVLAIRKDGTAILIQGNHNECSAYECLRKLLAKNMRITENEKEQKQNRIYLGICINEQKEVGLSYLVNSEDIGQAVNFTDSM